MNIELSMMKISKNMKSFINFQLWLTTTVEVWQKQHFLSQFTISNSQLMKIMICSSRWISR